MILPIKKELIPYRFDTELNGILYTFEVHYNNEYNFFTMDLYIGDEILVYGEKLIYNQPIFQDVLNKGFPVIIPVDPSGKEKEITYSNFANIIMLKVRADAIQ